MFAQEKGLNPTGLVCDTNMAKVTSCENGLLEYELCWRSSVTVEKTCSPSPPPWDMEYDTGSGVSALLGGGFVLIFGQIVSIRGKELSKTNLEALNSTKSQKASLPVEVRRAMLVSQTMKRRPCWCPKPVLWELNSFLMQMLSFVPKNLHRCWPREWKHSISYFTVVCSVHWPLHRSKAGGDVVLLQILLFFICKWSCSLVC